MEASIITEGYLAAVDTEDGELAYLAYDKTSGWDYISEEPQKRYIMSAPYKALSQVKSLKQIHKTRGKDCQVIIKPETIRVIKIQTVVSDINRTEDELRLAEVLAKLDEDDIQLIRNNIDNI